MRIEKINECFQMLSDIHKYEDDLVMRYAQAGADDEIERLHEALKKKEHSLKFLSESLSRNFALDQLFKL